MGMVEDFGKVILIKKEVVKTGSRSDCISDYIFRNTFASYDDLVSEVQKLEGAKSVQKGSEKWLECTHELLRSDKEVVVIKFVFPYCG